MRFEVIFKARKSGVSKGCQGSRSSVITKENWSFAWWKSSENTELRISVGQQKFSGSALIMNGSIGCLPMHYCSIFPTLCFLLDFCDCFWQLVRFKCFSIWALCRTFTSAYRTVQFKSWHCRRWLHFLHHSFLSSLHFTIKQTHFAGSEVQYYREWEVNYKYNVVYATTSSYPARAIKNDTMPGMKHPSPTVAFIRVRRTK